MLRQMLIAFEDSSTSDIDILYLESLCDLAESLMHGVDAKILYEAALRCGVSPFDVVDGLAQLGAEGAAKAAGVLTQWAWSAVPLLGQDTHMPTPEVMRHIPIDSELAATHLGTMAGSQLQTSEQPRDSARVAHILGREEAEVSGTVECAIALLWADIEQLFRYRRSPDNSTRHLMNSRLARELDGVRAYPNPLSHRPSVGNEEPRWGCDLAIILNGTITGHAHINSAELVQIKKSLSLSASAKPAKADPAGTLTPTTDTWRIDTAQLTRLLSRSQTASYWLIGATGALWCLPARWIHAVGAGHRVLDQESFTLRYLDARHVAVPLSQFLLELFLGT